MSKKTLDMILAVELNRRAKEGAKAMWWRGLKGKVERERKRLKVVSDLDFSMEIRLARCE